MDEFRNFMRKFFCYARKVGQVAREVHSIIPKEDDNILQIVVKSVAALESIERHAFGSSKRKVDEFFEGVDVINQKNVHFVDIFFSTKLMDLFKCKHMILDEVSILIEASRPDVGTIYFLQHSFYDGRKSNSNEFWFSPDFKFDRALDLLWEVYEGKIHLDMYYDKNDYRMHTKCSNLLSFPIKLIGKNEDIISKLALMHLKYVNDNVPRTYLFLGQPGVGKSISALRFSSYIGGKVLRIDSSSLSTMTLDNLDFVLSGFKPDVVIFDDIDKVKELKSSLPTLLTVFQDTHRLYPNVAIILTAADMSQFDHAMIRPERVDEIIKFDVPDENDRKLIFQSSDNVKELSEEQINELISKSDGLTAAYLQEACLRLKYHPYSDVVNYIIEYAKMFGKKI